jgi:hypothetical protein
VVTEGIRGVKSFTKIPSSLKDTDATIVSQVKIGTRSKK